MRAMPDLPPGLHPGMRASFVLADGTLFTGEVGWAKKGWVRLQADTGTTLVNLAHVALIKPLAALDESAAAEDDEDALAKPRPIEAPVKVGPTAPGRPWTDEDLRQLADGFLDGVQDGELAERHHRSRPAIGQLRKGFECARGNLVEEEIPPVARTWIARWRKVLTK